MKHRRGFTLIEVAIFLAVTGLLFLAVTVGVQNSIYQQRFNDSVQGFTDFLRNVYSGVLNVQNVMNPGGRSEKAIYGKLVTFGETYKSESDVVNAESSGNVIYTYDVIGDVGDLDTNNLIEALKALNANVIVATDGTIKPVGIIESYAMKWAAQVEPACSETNCEYTPFVGALLVVRHPRSGTVYTYVLKGETIEVREQVDKILDNYEIVKAEASRASTEEERVAAVEALNNYSKGVYGNVLADVLDKFKIEEVDFCVNSTANEVNNVRRDVRISANARNSSGVFVVSDDNDNHCVRGQ